MDSISSENLNPPPGFASDPVNDLTLVPLIHSYARNVSAKKTALKLLEPVFVGRYRTHSAFCASHEEILMMIRGAFPAENANAIAVEDPRVYRTHSTNADTIKCREKRLAFLKLVKSIMSELCFDLYGKHFSGSADTDALLEGTSSAPAVVTCIVCCHEKPARKMIKNICCQYEWCIDCSKKVPFCQQTDEDRSARAPKCKPCPGCRAPYFIQDDENRSGKYVTAQDLEAAKKLKEATEARAARARARLLARENNEAGDVGHVSESEVESEEYESAAESSDDEEEREVSVVGSRRAGLQTPLAAVMSLIVLPPNGLRCFDPFGGISSNVYTILSARAQWQVCPLTPRLDFLSDADFGNNVTICTPPASQRLPFLQQALEQQRQFCFLVPLKTLENDDYVELYKQLNAGFIVPTPAVKVSGSVMVWAVRVQGWNDYSIAFVSSKSNAV